MSLSTPDPRVHIVIDANVLAAGLSAKTHRQPQVVQRSKSLLAAIVKHGWPGLQLHTPSFCLAETQCVFDKHFHCRWHGAAKDPQFRLTAKQYATASTSLTALTSSRHLQRLDVTPDHLAVLPLGAAVNYRYQYRRKSKDRATGKVQKDRVRPPMGAADVLLLAVAIDLSVKLGVDDVVIVTADKRLADVVAKCRTLKAERAAQLGLGVAAAACGIPWSTDIYPRCVDLGRATDEDLATALRGWPLPSRNVLSKTSRDLDAGERKTLFEAGLTTKANFGVGPDSLPYTLELDQLQISFAQATGIYLRKADIARQLLHWRKNPAGRPS